MTNNNFRKDADYWNNKLSVYLHDPPDKALRIQGHQTRSAKLAQMLGDLPNPETTFDLRSDVIASGMDRIILPGYNSDESKSGAVDFAAEPVLTHPTGDNEPLRIFLSQKISLNDVTDGMKFIIDADLGVIPGQGGLSDRFRGNAAYFAAARFHYVHHVFRERLVQENVGGLGALWYRMPADTRIPDHSIWRHCAMVSALTSCIQTSRLSQASLMVFNITPVQDFISRARKLRDFLTASLMLSWLGFEAIRSIIYEFGSDHIIYPSVISQPMINNFLADELALNWLLNGPGPNSSDRVASLPNKFVCLVPAGNETDIAEGIRRNVATAWNKLGENLIYLLDKHVLLDDYLKNTVTRQFDGFWQTNWATCPLIADRDGKIDYVKKILSENVWKYPLDLVTSAKQMHPEWDHSGANYSISHALTQAFLAAGKTRKEASADNEPGIKCQLHGNLEILRNEWKPESDRNPRSSKDPFWIKLKESWRSKADFTDSERLSSIALAKRLGYSIFGKDLLHPLYRCFEGETGFPSTTEIALTDWLDQVDPLIREIVGKSGRLSHQIPEIRAALANIVHEKDENRDAKVDDFEHTSSHKLAYRIYPDLIDSINIHDADKYYAILIMDGDHMGKLINGETIGSSWKTVIHPKLSAKLCSNSFNSSLKTFWENNLCHPRLLAPSVHAGISESLADFSLFTVPAVIQRAKGKLIYAGGDDVCAVLPLSSVISAARLIAKLYCESYRFFGSDAPSWGEEISGPWSPKVGKLSLHLGRSPNISISAGILVCHHKKPLYNAMKRAHELLDQAKSVGGRNAIALEFEKRSGGPLTWITKWNATVWEKLGIESLADKNLLDCFARTAQALASERSSRELSSSLIYRFREFSDGIQSLARSRPEAIKRFVTAHMGRSFDKKSPANAPVAAAISALLVRADRVSDQPVVDPSPLMIARAMAGRMQFDPFVIGGKA